MTELLAHEPRSVVDPATLDPATMLAITDAAGEALAAYLVHLADRGLTPSSLGL